MTMMNTKKAYKMLVTVCEDLKKCNAFAARNNSFKKRNDKNYVMPEQESDIHESQSGQPAYELCSVKQKTR